MDEDAGRLAGALTGVEAVARGTVRVVATDALGVSLAGPLAALHREHPSLTVELLATSSVLHYRVGEFDVAVTLHATDLPQFSTAQIAHSTHRVYTRRDDPHPFRRENDLEGIAAVGYVPELMDFPEMQFLTNLVPTARTVFRSPNIRAQQEAIAAGVGVGVLPAILGDTDERLRSVLPEKLSAQSTYWVTMARAAAETLPVRLVLTRLTSALDALPGVEVTDSTAR